MKDYRPECIFVERDVRTSPITKNVLQALPDVPVREVDSSEPLLQASQRQSPKPAQAKRSLILARHKGRFFKPCPAGRTKEGFRNVCCSYFVINYASNCHMECSYCYLQSHLNFPHLLIYANIGDLLTELEEAFAQAPERPFRIGTGELADSLALDPLTQYSVPLVEFFARRHHAVLEFKTKSDCVENLLGLDHRGRTVVSWSLNPECVQQREEHKTATINERLEAAGRCVAAGYPVAFHLDPLIFYEHWERDYEDLIEEIFDRIPPPFLSWISLGSLRMLPGLKQVMRERFPGSRLPLGELVMTGDGKLRYFKPIRVEMYDKVLGWIRSRGPSLPVYACMENGDIWRKVFGCVPQEEELSAKLTSGLIPLNVDGFQH